MSKNHTTHHDDCGCLTARYEARIAELEQREREFDKLHAVQVARVEILIGEKAAQAERIATLEAELAASREDAKLAWAEAAMGPTEAAITHELAQSQAHANALRDALDLFTDNAVKCRGNELGEDYLRCDECDGQDWGSDPDCFDPDEHADGCKYKPENLRAMASKVLAQTPAASLAAHDAEVGLRVVSLCSMTMRSRCSCSHCDENMPGWKGSDIVERALAAQEVKSNA